MTQHEKDQITSAQQRGDLLNLAQRLHAMAYDLDQEIRLGNSAKALGIATSMASLRVSITIALEALVRADYK